MSLFQYPLSLSIGVALALLACGAATWAGFSRERSFYPTLVMVVATYYVLFAVLAGSWSALYQELLVMTAFMLLAVIGFQSTRWVAAAALALHGLHDAVHPALIANPGVPPWWPAFCGAFDLTAAAWLATSLAAGARRVQLPGLPKK